MTGKLSTAIILALCSRPAGREAQILHDIHANEILVLTCTSFALLKTNACGIFWRVPTSQP